MLLVILKCVKGTLEALRDLFCLSIKSFAQYCCKSLPRLYRMQSNSLLILQYSSSLMSGIKPLRGICLCMCRPRMSEEVDGPMSAARMSIPRPTSPAGCLLSTSPSKLRDPVCSECGVSGSSPSLFFPPDSRSLLDDWAVLYRLRYLYRHTQLYQKHMRHETSDESVRSEGVTHRSFESPGRALAFGTANERNRK